MSHPDNLTEPSTELMPRSGLLAALNRTKLEHSFARSLDGDFITRLNTRAKPHIIAIKPTFDESVADALTQLRARGGR